MTYLRDSNTSSTSSEFESTPMRCSLLVFWCFGVLTVILKSFGDERQMVQARSQVRCRSAQGVCDCPKGRKETQTLFPLDGRLCPPSLSRAFRPNQTGVLAGDSLDLNLEKVKVISVETWDRWDLREGSCQAKC